MPADVLSKLPAITGEEIKRRGDVIIPTHQCVLELTSVEGHGHIHDQNKGLPVCVRWDDEFYSNVISDQVEFSRDTENKKNHRIFFSGFTGWRHPLNVKHSLGRSYLGDIYYLLWNDAQITDNRERCLLHSGVTNCFHLLGDCVAEAVLFVEDHHGVWFIRTPNLWTYSTFWANVRLFAQSPTWNWER